MKILKTFARVFVRDLDQSLPTFETIVGRPADFRVPFENAQIASVGDFLLVAGPADATDKYRDTIGPVIVDDIEDTERILQDRGAETTRYSAPTGTGSYIRHQDGVVVEYLQWNQELVDKIINGRPGA